LLSANIDPYGGGTLRLSFSRCISFLNQSKRPRRSSAGCIVALSTESSHLHSDNEDIEQIMCRLCSLPLPIGSMFCLKCGASVTIDVETLRHLVENKFLPIREHEVSPSTIRVEKGFWKQILSEMGSTPTRELKSAEWENYIKKMKERGCSARTQQLHQSTYQGALKYATFIGLIKEPHKFRSIKGSTKKTHKTIPFTADEVQKLLDCCSSQMYRAMFGLGVGVGLRPSELCRVSWEDIDLKTGLLRVLGSKTAGSDATIPLTELAKREMKQWWKTDSKRGLCFYVTEDRIDSASGQKIRKKKQIGSFKTALQAAARRAKIDITSEGVPRRIFPYILRHSFATLAASSNPPVPLPVAQAVMRHTSSKMLLETYAKAGALLIKDGLRNFKV